jgi:transcription termination factor Rho
MELHLSRRLAERRLFPAIDINRSGTRKEEMLLGEKELEIIWKLRQQTQDMTDYELMNTFLKQLKNTQDNEELLEMLDKVFKD